MRTRYESPPYLQCAPDVLAGRRSEFAFELLRGEASPQARPCACLLRSIPPGYQQHIARTGRRLANLLSGECTDHSGIFGLSSTRTSRFSREDRRLDCLQIWSNKIRRHRSDRTRLISFCEILARSTLAWSSCPPGDGCRGVSRQPSARSPHDTGCNRSHCQRNNSLRSSNASRHTTDSPYWGSCGIRSAME